MFFSWQGNKLTVLSNNLIASWTMLTELIACNYLWHCYFLYDPTIFSFNFHISINREMHVFCAAKNLLNGMPETIGSLSRLIRLDLHQNSE